MISLQRKSTRLALGVGAVALLALAAWALSRHSTAPLPDKGALQAPAASGNQTLHFAPGAPQLAYLRIEAAVEGPVPLLEPLNGRLAYDENHTARVFAPVQGRVLKVLTEPGTQVKAGQPLVTLEEKQVWLGRAADEGWRVVFQHDPHLGGATIRRGPRDFELGERFL